MKKVTWKTDAKTTYSLNEIADAVYHNTSSKESTYRKKITVGIAARYGYHLDHLMKHTDTARMFDIPNYDRLSDQEVERKRVELYECALNGYNDMLSPIHDMSYDLMNKIGIVHNTMNCNKWANSKSRTI